MKKFYQNYQQISIETVNENSVLKIIDDQVKDLK